MDQTTYRLRFGLSILAMVVLVPLLLQSMTLVQLYLGASLLLVLLPIAGLIGLGFALERAFKDATPRSQLLVAVSGSVLIGFYGGLQQLIIDAITQLSTMSGPTGVSGAFVSVGPIVPPWLLTGAIVVGFNAPLLRQIAGSGLRPRWYLGYLLVPLAFLLPRVVL